MHFGPQRNNQCNTGGVGSPSSSLALGYSASGRIVEVGPDVVDLRVGERVACAGAGYANHAEVNFVPRNLVARIPDEVSYADAAFTTLGAIALQGLHRLAPTAGELQRGLDTVWELADAVERLRLGMKPPG